MAVASPTWIDHVDLLSTVPLSCVDGRAEREVVGSPGGTLGELVAVLTAAESILGSPLGADAVDTVLRVLPRALGPVYLHTDGHAMARLGERLGLGRAEIERLVAHPPEERREALLDALVRPEHTGCGHLAGLLSSPDTYGARPGLVEDVLRSFFRALWRGEEGFLLDVLHGEHTEEQVVVVHSCDRDRVQGAAPAVVPSAEGSAFVFHTDAARFYRRQLCRLLADTGYVGEAIDTHLLRARADAVMQRHLGATLARLAPDLPRRELVPPCAAPIPPDPGVPDVR